MAPFTAVRASLRTTFSNLAMSAFLEMMTH